MGKLARRLGVRAVDRQQLERLAAGTDDSVEEALKEKLKRRARIVLLAGQGLTDTEIAKQLSTSPPTSLPTVRLWGKRYARRFNQHAHSERV